MIRRAAFLHRVCEVDRQDTADIAFKSLSVTERLKPGKKKALAVRLRLSHSAQASLGYDFHYPFTGIHLIQVIEHTVLELVKISEALCYMMSFMASNDPFVAASRLG